MIGAGFWGSTYFGGTAAPAVPFVFRPEKIDYRIGSLTLFHDAIGALRVADYRIDSIVKVV